MNIFKQRDHVLLWRDLLHESAPEVKELSGEEWNALKGRRTGLTEHQSHVLGEVGV